MFVLVPWKNDREQGGREREREAGRRQVRTLYAAPGAAVQLQCLEEPPVLVLRPLLPLLRDGVRLPRLVRQAWDGRKQSEITRSDRTDSARRRDRDSPLLAVPWARAPPLTNPCRGDPEGPYCDDLRLFHHRPLDRQRRSRRLPSEIAVDNGGNTTIQAPRRRQHHSNQSARVNFTPEPKRSFPDGLGKQDEE